MEGFRQHRLVASTSKYRHLKTRMEKWRTMPQILSNEHFLCTNENIKQVPDYSNGISLKLLNIVRSNYVFVRPPFCYKKCRLICIKFFPPGIKWCCYTSVRIMSLPTRIPVLHYKLCLRLLRSFMKTHPPTWAYLWTLETFSAMILNSLGTTN